MVTQRGRPRPLPPLLPTVLIGLLLALLVLITPSVGSWELDARDFQISAPEPEGEAPQPPEEELEELQPDPIPEPLEIDSPQISPIWGQVILALMITLVLAGVAVLIWFYLRYRRSLTSDEVSGDLQVDAEVAAEDQVPVLARAAVGARGHLHAAADPTDAIIRAWLALEEAAATSGMHRRPADTPTELTVAVLDRTQADPQATTGLLGLYHRARFGTATMTSADRHQAIEHLDALARSWDQVRL